MDVNGFMRDYECVPFGLGSRIKEVHSEWFLLYQDLGNNPRAAFVQDFLGLYVEHGRC